MTRYLNFLLRVKYILQEIYAYATKPDYNPSDQLLMALSEDSRVRRDFEMLLRNTAPYFRLIAAE